MKHLKRWAQQQYERKMNALRQMDNRPAWQPAHPNRNHIAGQAAAFADMLEVLELPGEEE
ncbi:hypothetical protein [Corynebacterium propinquum]|uniref:hypothetical protein n=1 Tax=Corynebacterium propinquum TaxID=43769 RepID=UPI0011A444B0|nr:hypothetical protein [Corynebacterium propinquum]